MSIENTAEWQEYRLSKESVKSLESKIESYKRSLIKAVSETESYRKAAHAHCAELGHEYLKNEILRNVKIGTKWVNEEVVDERHRCDESCSTGFGSHCNYRTESVEKSIYEKQYVRICEFCKYQVGRKAEIKYV